MSKLLAFLWSGCWHKWKTQGYGDLVKTNDFGSRREGYHYTLRCEKCGRHMLEKLL